MVLLLATRNVLLSAYAMTTIVSRIVCNRTCLVELLSVQVGIVATLLSFVSAVVLPLQCLHPDRVSEFVDRWVTNLVWWKQPLL